MNLLIFIILSIIFLFTSFQKGLFFDYDFYWVHNVIFLLFIIYTINTLYKKEFNTSYYVIFLLPLAYFLSLFVAESPQGAWDNILRLSNYAATLIMLNSARSNTKINQTLPYVIHIAGFVVVVHVILAFFGFIDYQDAILNNRFAGVFQYPNTLAVFIGAIWLLSLIHATTINKYWLIVLNSFPWVLYGFVFIMTLSRGAFLILPIAWFVGLLFLNFQNQMKLVIFTLLPVGASVFLAREIASLETISSSGLWSIFISALLVSGSTIFIQFICTKLSAKQITFFNNKVKRLIIPVILVVISVLAVLDIQNEGFIYQQMPDDLQKRISSINTDNISVTARGWFMQDALKIIDDYSLLGTGGEGWRVLFTRYQEVPYWSKEIHNGYLEWLISSGWVGTILFVGAFLYMLYQIIIHIKRSDDGNRAIIVSSLSALLIILMHSAIDFDMSYGTIWYLMIWLLAIALPMKPYKIIRLNETKSRKINIGLMTTLTVCMLILIIYAFRFFLADYSMLQNGSNKLSVDTLKKITQLNPYNTEYKLKLAQGYAYFYKKKETPEYAMEMKNIIDKTMELEPNNANIKYYAAMLYYDIGERDQAVLFIKDALKMDQFNTEYFLQNMKIKTETAYSQLVVDKNNKKALDYAKQTVTDYKEISERYKVLGDMIKKKQAVNQREFKITPEMNLYAAQSYFLLRDYESMTPIATNLANAKDKNIKVIANALLVATFDLQGNKDQAKKIRDQLKKEFESFEDYVKAYKKLNM